MVSRYELAKNFKVGQLVRIKDNIDTTIRIHRVDPRGKMRNMVGRSFKIKRVDDGHLHIGDFVWAPEDVIDLSEDLEPLPLPQTNIMFDPKELL